MSDHQSAPLSPPHLLSGRAPGDSLKQGLVHLTAGRLAEAEALFREELRTDPNSAVSWTGLARVQAERGDLEEACRSARSALAISPIMGEAFWRLAITERGRMPGHEFQAMSDLACDTSRSNFELAMLKFGLATVLDERGRYADAASHLRSANALQSLAKAERGLTYDPDQHSAFIARLIATFSPEWTARAQGWIEPQPKPVFVVGVPRSGTTLVEQILASHPQIHGAGELFDVHNIFHRSPQLVGQPNLDPFDALKLLDPVSAKAAAQRYLVRLDALAPSGAARVVDKMPDNVRLLGLIAVLWPGARVILCARDPRDAALSCWQTGFTTNPWCNNWEHIARRFADYQRIVDHWRRTQPLEWLDVRYENLVADLEGHARRLIDFVGLEWDSACLEFHSTRRVVRTPSLVQVRRPIHSHSVGRWKNYEPSLQELFRALERHEVRVDESI